jgi:electron transfer flavoprotein alpha subunit
MKEILVLAEHRLGKLRDVTFEVLTKGRKLARENNACLTAVIIGYDIGPLGEELTHYADEVLIYDDHKVKEFHSEYFRQVLSHIILDRKPEVILIPHTSYGLELAPSLAIELNIPIITDVLEISFENGRFVAVREYFGGKLRARIILRESPYYIATVRAGISKSEKNESRGRVIKVQNLNLMNAPYKRIIGLIKPPPEAVDITSADVIVAVGRGIGDAKNLPLIEELSKAINGVIACSRPVVDMKWLPKERLVGLSGKVVKPKLYLAIGISGQFYHVYGMMNSELIIAINKDPNAPIFGVADYGIVEDLFKVVPQLVSKIMEKRMNEVGE